MATKEELQDMLDELSLELERARDASATDARIHAEEVGALSTALSSAEEEASRLREMVRTLTEGQRSLTQIYEEKEQMMLSRVGAESRRMAEAGERWTAERSQLEEELAERDETIETLREETRTQAARADEQARRAASLSLSVEPLEGQLKSKAARVNMLEIQVGRLESELRARGEPQLKPRSFILDTLELVSSNAGCWFMALTVTLVMYIAYRLVSWIWLSMTQSGTSLGT